jgi:amidase
MKPLVASYCCLEELPERKLPVKYPRTSGWRPMPEDNPSNGWYWRCQVEGAPEGPLKGEKAALKDVVWPGRRADDERLAVARRLCPGR